MSVEGTRRSARLPPRPPLNAGPKPDPPDSVASEAAERRFPYPLPQAASTDTVAVDNSTLRGRDSRSFPFWLARDTPRACCPPWTSVSRFP